MDSPLFPPVADDRGKTRTDEGEGKALAIKYREMVIIGILAFRGASQEGMLAHMRRAIQHARRG